MRVNNDFMRKAIETAKRDVAKFSQAERTCGVENFERVLNKKLEEAKEVKFSKHARLRLEKRSIQLTDIQQDKLKKAVEKAAQKGINDSLVIMDDITMLINIKSRTVITAMNKKELENNVFTNIDGAVFT